MPFLKAWTILFFIACISSQEMSKDKPFLRIVAPNYLCDEPAKSNSSEKESNNKLTVGLQTRDGQRLKYRISIDFNSLDGFKNQRHTLSIWKNVRELQAKFAVKNVSDEISLRNQIEIDALELTPQVVYTFKIIGFDDNNQASDEQNFTITYKGDQLQAVNSNVGDGVSLLLYGPETFYNDLEFLAVADVLFCDPINDYYYQWQIEGITSSSFSEEYLDVKGSVLKLPTGLFDDDKSYEIRVTILNDKSQALASLSLPIKVYSKEINTQNIPADCNVGVNREVPFVTALYPNSMTQYTNIKWTCSIEDSECSNVFTNSTESLRVSAIFPSEGSYLLNADVTVKGNTKSSNTRISADAKVIPHIEIKYFPQQPLSAVDSNEIVATIMNLVPKCVAYWNIVSNEEGFAKPKDESMSNVGLISIKDYEEHFLQELVDYDNNTLSKDTTLTIPADSLHPDSRYKFRLNVICPEPITDVMSPTDRQNITTYFDIVFETNGPPRPLPLVVLPLKGIPMRDEFTFKTGAARERQSDYPLRYSFGYQVDNLTIAIGTFYEYQVARTQLPYSDEIKTFMQVTDNNNASVYVKGPKIRANVEHKFTQDEIDFKLSEIRGTLKRSEYSKTLNSAVVLILTQRKFSSTDDAKKYEEQIYQMLNDELKSLKSKESSTFVHQQNVIEFVRMIKNLLSIMTVYDEAFVENILNLTEQQSRRIKRTALSNSMRNRSIMTNDPDYIKNVLSLSDMLLSSSNIETVRREKKRYVEKVHKFISSLCQDQNLNSYIIQSKYVAFEVSKMYSRQLFIATQKFPSDTATVVFSSNSNFPSKFVCIAKVKFMIDMFGESENTDINVYETRIMDDDGHGQKETVQSKNLGEFVIMEMEVKNGNANEQLCFIWTSNQWISNECEQQVVNQSRIACKCRTFEDSVIIKYQKSSGSEQSKNEPTMTTKYSNQVTSPSSVTGALNEKSTEASTVGVYNTESNIEKITIVTKNPSSGTIVESPKSTTLEASTTVMPDSTMGHTEATTNEVNITTAKNDLSSEKSTVPTAQSNPFTEATTQQHSSNMPDQLTTIIVAENIIKTTITTEALEITTAQNNPKNQSTDQSGNNTIQPSTIVHETITTESSANKSNQATENNKSSTTISAATSAQSTTIEPEKIQLSTEVSKHVATTINSISTDGKKQTTTEKTTYKELDNKKDVSESNTEKKTSTEAAQTIDKSKLQTTLMPSTIVTRESNTNSSTANVVEANFGLNIWFVIGILCLFFGLILLLVLLHRCRRFSENHINLPMRHPSNNIKYAKYHDEFIMRG